MIAIGTIREASALAKLASSDRGRDGVVFAIS